MFISRCPSCPNSPLLDRGNMGHLCTLGHLIFNSLKPYILKENKCPKFWDTLGHQKRLGHLFCNLGHL